jgi:hypothetical protein
VLNFYWKWRRRLLYSDFSWGQCKEDVGKQGKGGDDEGDNGSLPLERWVWLGGHLEGSPCCEVFDETDTSLFHSISIHSHSCSYTC